MTFSSINHGCFYFQFAAEKAASMDQGMQYPAEVGVNAYVRVKLSFLGQQVSDCIKWINRILLYDALIL